MKIVNQVEIAKNLDYEVCIDLLDKAMRATSAGEVVQPLRWGMPLPDNIGVMGMMPGCVPDINRSGIKIVNILPGNPAQGRSSHIGSFMLFDLASGETLAIIDSAELTARRTAAASALATKILARESSRTLTILGAGEQALHHFGAISTVRRIEQVKLWNRTAAKADALAEKIALSADIHIAVYDEAREAVRGTDILCTVTSSPTPILQADWLEPGMHVNAVGASDASRIEIAPDCIDASQYFVDCRISAANQAGELIAKIADGNTLESLIAGEIGEVLLGKCEGRVSEDSTTVYRSLGVAAQDIYAAQYLFECNSE